MERVLRMVAPPGRRGSGGLHKEGSCSPDDQQLTDTGARSLGGVPTFFHFASRSPDQAQAVTRRVCMLSGNSYCS